MHTVLLADDHSIILQGLKSLVNALDDFEVTATATSVEEASAWLRKQPFDLLVTDYEMPPRSGLELIQLIAQAQLPTRSLVLSMHQEVALVQEALAAGANGYLLKKDSHHDLQYALRKVMEQGQYISDAVAGELLHKQNQAQAAPRLTPREKQVLELVLQELTSKEIASKLFISERTVETHRKNIWRKSGAKTLIGLMNKAREWGWIT